MRFRMLNYAKTFLLTMVIVSCGSDSSSDVGVRESLNDNWESVCVEGSNQISSIFTWTFKSDNSFSMKEIQHDQPGCKDEHLSGIYSGSGTFVFTVSTDEGISGQLALTYQSFSFVPRSQDLVDYFNEQGFCRSSDWAVAQKENLFDQNCQLEGKGFDFPDSSAPYLDIFDLSGESLWLGDKDEPYFDRGLPTKINDNIVFSRQ